MPRALPDTIVWDFNGTLLEDVQACFDALNVILRAHHCPTIDRDYYRKHFGFPVINFYRALGIPEMSAFDWEALAESFHMRYLFSKHLTLQPGALEAIAFFRSHHISQGVLSALEQGLLEMQLRQFGLFNAMNFVCGSRNYDGASKLDTARTLKLTGNVLLIGDTLHDAEVANAMKWDCMLCSAGHQTAERLRAANVPIFASLTDLIALFEDKPRTKASL